MQFCEKAAYRAVLSLGKEEVEQDSLDHAPGAVDNVRPPGNPIQRNRNAELSCEQPYERLVQAWPLNSP